MSSFIYIKETAYKCCTSIDRWLMAGSSWENDEKQQHLDACQSHNSITAYFFTSVTPLPTTIANLTLASHFVSDWSIRPNRMQKHTHARTTFEQTFNATTVAIKCIFRTKLKYIDVEAKTNRANYYYYSSCNSTSNERYLIGESIVGFSQWLSKVNLLLDKPTLRTCASNSIYLLNYIFLLTRSSILIFS